jgi:hypothetical protein
MMPIKFRLYEAAVANADALARFARAVHGASPVTLAEDFAGTGALARAWVDLHGRHRAVACDRDARVTRHIPGHARLRVATRDVLRETSRCDVLAATNFAVGYWRTRKELLAYFRHARSRLQRGGLVFCDIYGGDGAMSVGVQRVRMRDQRGRIFWYEWEQHEADAATGIVTNFIHFELPAGFERSGSPRRRIERAFGYVWRLWGVPELVEAMREAGFEKVEVYDRTADALDEDGNVHVAPVAPGAGLEATYVVYIAGRK